MMSSFRSLHNTTTHCHAAELLWDEKMAKRFRQTLIRAIGRDCFCHEDEHCWLMDSALKGVQARQAATA
jgi:hypothetical protein